MSIEQHPTLLTPVQLGPYTLRNRMVMAPMTRNRAGEGNVPSASSATYYAQRASAGLIVTEGTQVSPQGVGYPGTPGHPRATRRSQGWRQVTDAVHERGGRIFLQLWHVGRISHPLLQPDGALPVAPSAIAPEGQTFTLEGPKPFVAPRALEIARSPASSSSSPTAPGSALAAGFDGVEIHGANGYLIDQFLRDGINQRTDPYGGPVENRARFLLEVTEAVAGVWGADRVGVRLSPPGSFNAMSDSDPAATFGYAPRELDRFGLAYLHVVEPLARPGGDPGRRALLRPLFHGPFILNGGYDRETGNAALAAGEADLISFGMLFLANPDLPERFAEGAAAESARPGDLLRGRRAGLYRLPDAHGSGRGLGLKASPPALP